MERLGMFLHEFGGVFVARCDEDVSPELDGAVVNSSLERIGKIVDVIGPVERPYVVIEKDGKAPQRGSKLYLRD